MPAFRTVITRALVAAVTSGCFALLGAAPASATPDVGGAPAASGPAMEHAPGRVLVQYRDEVSGTQEQAVEHALGATRLSRLDDPDVQVLRVAAGTEERVVRGFIASGKTRYAELDGVLHQSDLTPNDPYYPAPDGVNGGQWSMRMTQAPKAWDITTGSSSVVIAVIDGGVVGTLADFAGKMVPGWNVLTGTPDTQDSNGHGTEVAGVAAAATNNGIGVAGYCWTCKIMPVKVTTTSTATWSDVSAGVTWAADHGAKVINISMAGTSSSTTLANAVASARAKGAVVVAAAGNAGTSTPMYPAATAGVIGVAATDQVDALAAYSSYGSWVQVAAPGANTTTLPNGDFGPVGGTSMASPVVAGIAGLLFSANPDATGTAIENAILGTTDPLNDTKVLAHGRVNAFTALQAVAAVPVPVAAPSNSALPMLSGTAQDGQTVTASTGTWSGGATSYGFQWQRCDTLGAGCAAIVAAVTGSYPVTTADVGSTLRAAVTASNSGGSTTAVSSPSAVVVAAPPPPPPPPTTSTRTFTGNLGGKVISAAYPLSLGTGATHAELSFAKKCGSLALVLRDAGGGLIAQVSAPSLLLEDAGTSAGTYTYTVSGTCRTSFTLTITTPA
ncbi:S8 family serine peptidase [Pengzhenrongella sp.]|uniref:S8 family serine peptidase n=1 Tax=Pengzhenrongella sp. TaxID=2888820 RepID=UPI002F9362ED